MKVAFGATVLDRGLNNPKQDGIDGIGQYCQELIQHFPSLSNAPHILPYAFGQMKTKCGSKMLPNYPRHVLGAFSHLDVDHFFGSVDLVHSTDQFIPICNKPMIATVMDVIPLSHPHFLKSKSRYIKSFIWKKLTQRCDQIITISEFSKQEIIKYLDFSPERINVIPLGVDQRYFERVLEGEKLHALEAMGIHTPFFLFIGSIQPRKNLLNLVEAHSKLPRNLAHQYPLVIAGKLAWDDGKTIAAIKHAVQDGRAHWLNYVTEFQKKCLLQSAIGLAFVSLYEGFGLPIVEAYASELPVITSNCTSMPEVASDAAILVNPHNMNAITDGLLSLIEDPSLCSALSSKGKVQVKKFSWHENTKQTLDVYRSVI